MTRSEQTSPMASAEGKVGQARPITAEIISAAPSHFWEKATCKGPDECWEWRKCRDLKGYGRIKIKGQYWPAHRIAYALAKSAPQVTEIVRHKCDNPPCINPAHLELGDHAANARDRMLRGREPDRRGVGNGRVRLTESDVRDIRASPVGHRPIARIYGVAPTTIRDLRSGRNWGHIR